MFGEWNESIAIYSPVFIIGVFILYLIVKSHWYRLRLHLKKNKWLLASLIAVLVIGSGYYYHFIYNTPIKRIERLVEKYEQNKKLQNNIDEVTKYVESKEFQDEMEDNKKRIEAARVKNENAIPWISYGFYLVILIYGCVFVFLWLRHNRRTGEK